MYATTTDMISRFGLQELIDLTDRDGTSGALVEPVLTQALADASAEIDGYIGGRYKLPLVSVPAVLTRICCDIARFHMYDERAPDAISERYNNATKFLASLGKGELSLGLQDEGEDSPSQNLAEISSAGSVFSRENSKGFI
ncbi:MAG: gp436 family protein [Pontibacterium sp.]